MTRFHELQKELENYRCPTCKGLGYVDDAGLGDISFNKWKCPDCGGSGLTVIKLNL